ncbi:hypothetical protein O6H91_18G057700 [Diphasiastrum complanatum]|uniref:Uncharacterized protein n=1 Tax=Diphasiastrum complanatum TaxID=34168 RepID=A0ACC2B1I0_DIPCM|nr:hypothetical protein O6H91_18G057700 [Diphasiastrum complanatum]
MVKARRQNTDDQALATRQKQGKGKGKKKSKQQFAKSQEDEGSSSKTKKKDKCFHCGRKGHWKSEWRKFLAEQGKGKPKQAGNLVDEGEIEDSSIFISALSSNQDDQAWEKYGTLEENYDDFTAALLENDCRYAVFSFDFVTDEYCQKSKIFFIAWSPDTVRVKAKMIYANSNNRFLRELDGVHYELQATDPMEMDIEVIKDRAH